MSAQQYVYVKTEPRLWTVGFYDPLGAFIPESDHGSTEAAAERVRYLGGEGGNSVYIRSEQQLWTSGSYDSSGRFNPESDHDTAKEAAEAVHRLNGGWAQER